MNNKKGFTLVELLAVIAILAILVIIALPNVLKLFNDAKKKTFLTEAQTIYKEATKKYINESVKGKTVKSISSEGTNKLDISGEKMDYCITLDSQGNVTSMKVGNGEYYIEYSGGEIEDIDISNIKEGKIDARTCRIQGDVAENKCTFDGDLVEGATYINGQYKYKYKVQPFCYDDGCSNLWDGWLPMEDVDGWSVVLNDRESTDPVTTPLCTSINDKPIVSMAGMFAASQTTSVDFSSFDTSNVINMNGMFDTTSITNLDLTTFDTSNVADMYGMFWGSNVITLDLSSFDTSNVGWMDDMFYSSDLVTIYVSDKWNTSNVVSSGDMFWGVNNLVGGAGTTWNSSNPKDKTYAHVDGGPSNPGYFTLKTN